MGPFGRAFFRSRALTTAAHFDYIPARLWADHGLVGYSSGQRGQTVNLLAYAYEGSNPSPTTTLQTLPQTAFHPVDSGQKPGLCILDCAVLCACRALHGFHDGPEIWVKNCYKTGQGVQRADKRRNRGQNGARGVRKLKNPSYPNSAPRFFDSGVFPVIIPRWPEYS